MSAAAAKAFHLCCILLAATLSLSLITRIALLTSSSSSFSLSLLVSSFPTLSLASVALRSLPAQIVTCFPVFSQSLSDYQRHIRGLISQQLLELGSLALKTGAGLGVLVEGHRVPGPDELLQGRLPGAVRSL